MVRHWDVAYVKNNLTTSKHPKYNGREKQNNSDFKKQFYLEKTIKGIST